MNQLRFTKENGKETSVVQYYMEKYNHSLRHGTLPCLQCSNDARRPIFLPMEVCKIAERQRYMMKLNEKQVSSLLKSTCERPDAREKIILDMVNRKIYINDKYVKEFCLQVTNQLVTVDARVLPPPQLRYHESGKDKVVCPKLGQWNMIDKKMVNGGKVEYWTCFNFSHLGENAVGQFCNDLRQMCNNKGMMFTVKPLIRIRSAHSDRIYDALKDIKSESSKAIGHNEGRDKATSDADCCSS